MAYRGRHVLHRLAWRLGDSPADYPWLKRKYRIVQSRKPGDNCISVELKAQCEDPLTNSLTNSTAVSPSTEY